jgi:hypothetical protein
MTEADKALQASSDHSFALVTRSLLAASMG